MPAQGKGQSAPTHESSLALLLHEEQLSPVSGSCLHPKDHQVAQRQHPQERREQELRQGALAGTWGVQVQTARWLTHVHQKPTKPLPQARSIQKDLLHRYIGKSWTKGLAADPHRGTTWSSSRMTSGSACTSIQQLTGP